MAMYRDIDTRRKTKMLKQRVTDFLIGLGLPKSRFAANVGISISALKKWLNGDLELSKSTLKRIDEFLRKYNG